MPDTSVQNTPTQKRSARREPLLFVLVLSSSLLLAGSVAAFIYGPAYLASVNYEPQEGDIVFQSLPHSPLIDAIEGVSESPYSHCGLVARRDGRWVVYEAFGGVEVTPLSDFLQRGRDQGFAVYRLKQEFQTNVPKLLEKVQVYLGRPYDIRYRLDDEAIYCSELIWKAYRDATNGQQLGILVRLGDMPWQPHEATIRYFEQGPVPLDREMITPRHLAEATQLEHVMSHQLQKQKP